MSTNWTSEQQDAIAARGGPLLVSAAAGSGKTAVLVERMVGLILDEHAPVDADRLLVVTFTKAAAAEMRDRIDKRLSQELRNHPASAFLQRQKILLSRAHIGTVDSFCSDLVRENFSLLGIPADFRVADPGEMEVLRAQTLSRVLDGFYCADDRTFLELLDCFSAGRDDRPLTRMVQQLYDFVRSHPFPQRWLKDKAAMYRAEHPDETLWGKAVRLYAQEALAYCVQTLRQTIVMLQEDAILSEKCAPVLVQDLQQLETAAAALPQADWDAAGELLRGISFGRMAAVRGYKEDPLKLAADANRKEVKTAVQQVQSLLSCTAQECAQDFERLLPMVEKLFAVVETFGRELDAAKAERKLADFGDLEHWALRLLAEETPDGWKRTRTAEETAQRYDEILVDEYQDTNELQDLLFRAVSKEETNLFMVGDVKQSIYGFRQAEAGLFLSRRSASAPYDRLHPHFPAYITLGRNFRSRAGVTETVNFLFQQLMSEGAGGLDYTDRDALYCGAQYPDSVSPDVELDLLERRTDTGDAETAELECRRIAEYVLDFLQNGTVFEQGQARSGRFRDVCILLRSANQYAPVYARLLGSLGIPAWADPGGGFFGTLEVRTVLSFLRTIDNPLQDIPLLAVLASPIYGFTPDELAQLRIADRKGPLYFAVRKASAHGNERCAAFLRDLRDWRAQAAAMPANRFIDFLLRQSGYQDMVLSMDNGETRLANLHLLLEYARKYETAGSGGLSGFIRFVDRLQEEGGDLGAAASGRETADVVRIMSIHRSKGLEFPVVILAGCGRRFHRDVGDVRLHPKLGLGVKLRDEATGCRYTTLPRNAAALEQERDEMSEELRVLYVALTRAKEKLFMLCSISNVEARLTSLAAKLGQEDRLPAFLVRRASCVADWLLLCALRHPDAGRLRQAACAEHLRVLPCTQPCAFQIIRYGSLPEAEPAAVRLQEADSPAAPPDEALLYRLREEITFVYPYAPLERVRAKTAASNVAAAPFEKTYAALSCPAFLNRSGLTPAQRGTALHSFLQYADYQKAAQEPQAELDRLRQEAFLTEEEAAVVNLEAVRRFFASPLAQRMLQSAHVYREYRFTVELPASRLDASLPAAMGAEPVVVQGAVDCAFEENGGLVLLDYKTDRDADSGKLLEHYGAQLAVYKEALQQCIGLPVRECYLYAFAVGKAVRAAFSDT
ncbi:MULTISPECIES: helicase-exonuclease AddAB subunit AddA [Caproicibacterium]|uniref:DNA 3'-5' helicase n=1 Tax=Caproicibacterium argilliputei TaxID=3030016 RepID=A0AA97H2A2_9FIRM|nr:helicase-exonuclease AddAB subunit AddA [Caproicibacterium argilliputei]WOC33406.1 helicase-exonuclease AddAB subunit AddA [Caproicibacterium argilliputei]